MSLPRTRRILAKTGTIRHGGGGRISSSASCCHRLLPVLVRCSSTTATATATVRSTLGSSSSFLSSQRSLIRHAGGSLAVASSPPRYFSSSFSPASDEQSNTTRTSDYNSGNDSNDSEPIVRGSVVVSPEDERQEETKRKRLSEVLISEVLKAKHSYRWVDPVIPHDATLQDAIQCVIDGGLSGMMVVEPPSISTGRRAVVGLVTSRDLLRILAAGLRAGDTPAQILQRRVGESMTPISQVIYGRPEETIGMCRTIMAKLGIKTLPILSKQGTVEGLITARDMSDFGLTAKDKGGKQSFLKDVSQRVGLTAQNTSMADPPDYLKAHLALEQAPLFINTAVAALPHPFKTHEGVAGRSKREIRQAEYSSDLELSEDSHFITEIALPDDANEPSSLLRRYTYMGVADGVGSWREYGVDVRNFSRRLMQECENILLEACHERSAEARHSRLRFSSASAVIAPAELMAQAYERVKQSNIVGSSTACVALFDGLRHQLHFSNLGDSGLIVLRHIDSDVAGALRRDRTTPRTERHSDLRLAFVSQQQLRSFNHPYQLGWTGEALPPGETTSFKAARDSCTSSVHLRRGDIIIIATDGLFDNVDADEIGQLCLEWEESCGFLRGGDIAARERRWSMGNSLTHVSAERIDDLAATLTQRARENSLNTDIDSPFALLAKENDIMWSGGMPDDTTVIAIHVTGFAADDQMDHPNM